MARVEFTLTHPRYGTFSDALDVADDATPDQIAAAQQQRMAAWVELIENPPPPPPPPPDEE